MDENKELLALLQKIEKTNRQQVKLTRLVCVFALIAALGCGCLFGVVYSTLPQINAVMSQMQTVLSNLEETTAQLSAMDFTTMIENVDTLVATGQQGLEQTMEKLNSIDIETLNQAIGDLAAVVEPMSKLMSVFG